MTMNYFSLETSVFAEFVNYYYGVSLVIMMKQTCVYNYIILS